MEKNYRAELTGVFGDPVDGNPTGVVEEAAFLAKGLNYRYLTIKVKPDDLEAAIKSVRIFGMKGINLTMPHKVKVIPYLDELSQSAGIINRNIEKGKELAELISQKACCLAKYLEWRNPMPIPDSTEILINATSVGFSPNVKEKPDIDYGTITRHMCVCDVVFNPAETVFLKEAAKQGAKTVNGLGMLVRQAALNFTLWTGVEALVEIMEEALKKEL